METGIIPRNKSLFVFIDPTSSILTPLVKTPDGKRWRVWWYMTSNQLAWWIILQSSLPQ